MRANSIRLRLLWRLVPVVAACCFLAAGFVYFGTRAELRDALNAQSDILALTIAGLEGDTISREAFGEGLERYAGDYLVRVWDADNTLIVDSNTALQGLVEGISLATAPTDLGADWETREYVLNSGETVLIARFKQEADELVLQVAVTSLVPMTLALLGAVLTATFLVRQGLTPLTSLSEELTQRSAIDLRKLSTKSATDELAPIIYELNSLFERIETSLKRERRFVDDAAHELRTPLSVIKAQCQAIDAEGLDEDTQKRLAHIVQGVDRMASLSSQLLDQARAEQSSQRTENTSLDQVLEDVVEELRSEAMRRDVTVEVFCKARPAIACEVEDMRVILRNILENALKFSGTPGLVHVRLTGRYITVEDNGAGIPEIHREQVFDRFFQVNKASAGATVSGTGLGLSIVQSIAARNGIRVVAEQSDVLSGACFRLVWSGAG